MKKLVIALTVAASCAVLAAPAKGGAKNKTLAPKDCSPARSTPKASPSRPAAKPAAKPKAPAAKGRRPSVQQSHHKMGMKGAGGHMRPPSRGGIHAHRPDGARYWGRPDRPPRMAGALRDWYWVESPWNYMVDGVYYYGEGYYFDGYNYCYNGGYHLVPPPVAEPVYAPVAQTVVAPVQTVVTPVAQPVAAPVQTVVTPVAQPVAVPPPPPPPPPPPRRGGLLNLLFGN